MEYFLTDIQKQIKQLARDIAEEQILPVRAKLDESEEFPWPIIKKMGDAGLFGIFIPEEYGGTKAGCMELCLVVEELSRVCSAVALCYAATALGITPVVMYGNDVQKRKYLPDVAAGKSWPVSRLLKKTQAVMPEASKQPRPGCRAAINSTGPSVLLPTAVKPRHM